MAKPKLPRPRAYTLLVECINSGLWSGWNRAHKHSDKPEPSWIIEQQINYIMCDIGERFDLEDEK